MPKGQTGRAHDALLRRREGRQAGLKVALHAYNMSPTPLKLANGTRKDAFLEVNSVRAFRSETIVRVSMWPPVEGETRHQLAIEGDLGNTDKGLLVEGEVIRRVAALSGVHAAIVEGMKNPAATAGPAAGALATPQIIE